MTNTHFTASDLADMRLPGLPTTKRGINLLASREKWPWEPVGKAGGGRAYPIDALPRSARRALQQHIAGGVDAGHALVAAEKAESKIRPSSMKEYQRKPVAARSAILTHIEQMASAAGTSFDKAVHVFVDLAAAGTLPDEIKELVAIANAKSSGTRATLSPRAIHYWRAALKKKGVMGLATKQSKGKAVPEWLGPLIKLYRQPSKPTLLWALENLPEHLPEGVEVPLAATARYWLNKLSPQERNRGRMGARAMRALQAYTSRTMADLYPTAIYVADGHTFDAEVINPRSGLPFRPEITTVIDVASRRAVGWSVALSENTFGVLEALRHAFTTSGVPDIFYADHGSGFNNAVMDAPLVGFLGRCGIQKHNALPYNSQARGVIERLHQSIWVRAAKELPTYMGKDMDAEARTNVYKLTRADIKTLGQSKLLLEWDEFIEFATAHVRAYNLRPHSALPRVRDADTGRLRNLSPDEVWVNWRLEGNEPEIVEGDEAEDMFRPQEIRKTTRGLVKLFSNTYFALELECFHGEEVLVGYDIHDAKRVWVRELVKTRDEIAGGRLIAVAEFEGNARAFFPVAVVQQAHENRVKARERRAQQKLQDIRAEGGARPQAIEHQPMTPFEVERQERGAAIIADLAEKAEAPKAAERNLDIEFAIRAIAEPETLTPGQRGYAASLCRKMGFRMLAEQQGIDLEALLAVSQTQHGEA